MKLQMDEGFDAEISRLSGEGLQLSEIAERLGISKQSIYDRRQVLKKQAERLSGSFEKKKKTPQSANADSSHSIWEP